MDFLEAKEKLQSIGQEDLLYYWHQLSLSEKEHLLAQVENLDLRVLQQQQQLYKKSDFSSKPLMPLDTYVHSGNKTFIELGLKAISDGKVGCLLIAGGQGTRLKIEGPKGIFPISVTKKSLFQLVAEKTLAAGKSVNRLLRLAIMTSPLNHKETVDFFKEHHYFGLDPQQCSFFSQKTLPFLNDEGRLFLSDKGQIAIGPDGNGNSLREFVDSGIYAEWKEKGIEYLSFILIDNPLADPFDSELVGYHMSHHQEVTVKAVLKKDPEEKVGVLVKKDNSIQVVEYTELHESEKTARKPSGELIYSCANISLFCFSMVFIRSISHHQLPLHKSYKAVKMIDSHEINYAWKFETFIFDCLSFAKSVKVIVYPREECFSPLKNAVGENSPATVREALQKRDRIVYKKVTGKEPPEEIFELPQDFYYPTKKLLEEYRGTNV